jgi:hypothetical protein
MRFNPAGWDDARVWFEGRNNNDAEGVGGERVSEGLREGR